MENLSNKTRPLGHQDSFPPRQKWWERMTFRASWIFGIGALLYVLGQLCFKKFMPSYICCTYIAFGIILISLLCYRIVRHKPLLHNTRLEDRSDVEALFAEARSIEPRLFDRKRPVNYDDKEKLLSEEMKRLEDVGFLGWTEYQILQFEQMLVEFLKVDDLKARTLSRLQDIKNYVVSRYDKEVYDQLEEKIGEVINNIDDVKDEDKDKDLKRDEAAESLRAELRTVLEYLASYDKDWAAGYVVIRGLMIFGVMAIPILLAMGLLPLIHSGGNKILSMFNWGLLGISGAITAVLLNLRKSNLVDVGDSQGKEELWRTILGAALGLVAGVLLYSMIDGGILMGGIFPDNVRSEKYIDIARSVFWGIASGFSFEWVFDRLSSQMKEES